MKKLKPTTKTLVVRCIILIVIMGTVGIASAEDTTVPKAPTGFKVSLPGKDDLNCITNGGKAGDTGLKTWCWEDVTIPFSGYFSGRELVIDSEGGAVRQLFNEGTQIKFDLQNTNKRAEFRTAPWQVNHAKGTEEWFGWSYTFGQGYIIDQNNEWLFFQVHHGVVGDSPHLELLITRANQYNGNDAGELFVMNGGNSPDKHPTGITPVAGDILDIVVHAIWDDAANGLLQVWINDNKVYDKQVATIYPDSPWGGNAKWGIYKWPWAREEAVQKSLDQGISHLETFMGPLRMITRKPGDVDYGKDSYSVVKPR